MASSEDLVVGKKAAARGLNEGELVSMNIPVAELVREVAAPVKVQADEEPSTFVYIQNRVTLSDSIQLHTALILPATTR